MDTSLILIFLGSLVLGFIKFGSLKTKDQKWQQKFAELFNDFVNFLIAGLVGYYFALVRWPLLVMGDTISASDLVLLAVFSMGLFGHLCVLSLNITEGIQAILKKVLNN